MLLRIFKARVSLVLLMLFYIGFSVLLHNPQLTSSLLTAVKGILNNMEDTSNLIAWLSVIGALLASVGAIASAVATKRASDMAKSSRDIAKSALSFQYRDSIKESVELVVATLISEKVINVNSSDKISVSKKKFALSLKRTDWIFAAQEVKSIIEQIIALAIDDSDEKLLMERYGRMLEMKLSVVNGGKGGTLFTSNKPSNSYIYTKITQTQVNIRDEDMFVVYLFTEEYSSYIVGSGQYPTQNICNYFNDASKLSL